MRKGTLRLEEPIKRTLKEEFITAELWYERRRCLQVFNFGPKRNCVVCETLWDHSSHISPTSSALLLFLYCTTNHHYGTYYSSQQNIPSSHLISSSWRHPVASRRIRKCACPLVPTIQNCGSQRTFHHVIAVSTVLYSDYFLNILLCTLFLTRPWTIFFHLFLILKFIFSLRFIWPLCNIAFGHILLRCSYCSLASWRLHIYL